MIVGSWPILGVLGYFGGTEKGTWGARIKILRPLFNTNALSISYFDKRQVFSPSSLSAAEELNSQE